ncbi:uncharacterized protein VTP21DRAFT_7865 [Calcarisporiella thermophila]|uniref:uncharacterized protein n=1 Tax=Calcarisporiella thermophila TaxID=911321 RepID=UPI003742630C
MLTHAIQNQGHEHFYQQQAPIQKQLTNKQATSTMPKPRVRVILYHDVMFSQPAATGDTINANEEGCANVQTRDSVPVKAATISGDYHLVLYDAPDCKSVNSHWYLPGDGQYSNSQGVNFKSLRLCYTSRRGCGGYS